MKMKRIYVSNECCTCRTAVFASGSINGESPRNHGDYNLWPYGIRETRKIANFDKSVPAMKNAGAGRDIYLSRTARAVLDLLNKDY
jgi:hypothetical protein